jgi:pyridoxal phosphate enzyme (YggS family)
VSRIAENLAAVRRRIEVAARRAGRSPEEVRICAVTKRSGLPEIREAVAAGACILGENRVQEARPKIEAASDLDVAWHMIGHLQRNKARVAVSLFDAIESVDSLALGRRLSDLGEERGRPVEVLAEVNTSGEEAKSGLPADGAEEAVAALRELPGLSVSGLMTMAPLTSDPAPVRSCFRALAELRERAGGASALPVLSMGMTNDFEIAVEEGSTLVRVGTAIFG